MSVIKNASVYFSAIAMVAVSLTASSAGAAEKAATATAGALAIRAPWMPDKTNFFQGEAASHDYPVYLSASEAARAAGIQVAYSNSVSVLPEASLLQVWVNDRAVGEMNLRGDEHVVITRLRLPPGLLVPGLNSVRFVTQAQHRVDCSSGATFELWTKVDGARTGLLIPTDAQQPAMSRSLDDLFGVNLSADGTTNIAIRVKGMPSASEIERYSGVVQTIEHTFQMPDPVVTLQSTPLEGSGLEIVIGTRDDLSDEGVQEHTSGLYLDPVNGRARLVVTAETDDDVARAVTDLTSAMHQIRISGSAAGQRAWQGLHGFQVDGPGAVSFSDVGLSEQGFRGRRWARDIQLSLPENFTAGAFEKAIVRLKGEAPGGLLPGSAISLRVNGLAAGSFPISGDNRVNLERQRLDIPFTLFHAGANTVSLDATMQTAADVTCETTANKLESSFILSGDSTIEFPAFANLRTGPNLARALTGRTGDSAPTHLDMAILNEDPALVSAAMTIIANQAANGNYSTVTVTFGTHPDLKGTGIIVGALSDIQPELAADVQSATIDVAKLAPQLVTASETPAKDAAIASDRTVQAGRAPVAVRVVSDASSNSAISSWTGWAVRYARELGFQFVDTTARHRLVMRDGSMLVGEYYRTANPALVAGLPLPNLSVSQSSWLLFSADSVEKVTAGVADIVKSGEWIHLSGRFAVFDQKNQNLSSIDADKRFYILPKNWRVWELPMVFVTILSDFIGFYVGLMLLLICALCLVTWRLVKRIGVNL